MNRMNPLSQKLLAGIFRTSPKDEYRIINREGSSIEFKESYNHGGMSQYFKAIAGFANNSGGYILFGVADKPRRLVGLKEKSLKQFEELKVEEFTKALDEYFSPEIRWEHCTFIFKNLSFGVIYVYPLVNKPCICRKSYDAKNEKYSLKEGDIYYRYGGRSERIKYSELAAIIDESRKNEEKQWLDFARKAAKIGVSNAALLDLNTGNISGKGGSIVLDKELLSQLVFVQEGQFVEKNGAPALRIIGDIKDISTGRIIVKETSNKVVRAIEPNEIIKAFLTNENIQEPVEYIKRICSSNSANYPVYFFIKQANIEKFQLIDILNSVVSRCVAKDKLIKRLQGKLVDKQDIPAANTTASVHKKTYYSKWISNELPKKIENVGYCVQSLLYLSDEEICKNETYIRKMLLMLFEKNYERAKSNLASNIRKVICRIDEALYAPKNE